MSKKNDKGKVRLHEDLAEIADFMPEFKGLPKIENKTRSNLTESEQMYINEPKDALDAPMDTDDVLNTDADKGGKLTTENQDPTDGDTGYGHADTEDHGHLPGSEGMYGIDDLDFVIPDGDDYSTDSLKEDEEKDEDGEKLDESEEDEDDDKKLDESDDEDEDGEKLDESEDEDENDKSKLDESDDEDEDGKKLDESEDEEDKLDESEDLDDEFLDEATVARIAEALGIDKSKLSEVQTLLSVSVNEGVKRRVAKLKERFQTKFEKALTRYDESMVEKVDLYATRVVEGWLTENKPVVEAQVRTQVLESLTADMFRVLRKHNVEVPKGKENLYQKAVREGKELAENYNKVLKAARDLKAEVQSLKRDRIVSEMTKGLSEVSAAKFTKLVEGVKFEDEAKFRKDTKLIRESLVEKTTKTKPLNEVADRPVRTERPAPKTVEVDTYADFLSKSND